MQFIRYRPATVLIDKESNVHLLKAADDLDAVCYGEQTPEYLTK